MDRPVTQVTSYGGETGYSLDQRDGFGDVSFTPHEKPAKIA